MSDVIALVFFICIAWRLGHHVTDKTMGLGCQITHKQYIGTQCSRFQRVLQSLKAIATFRVRVHASYHV